MCYINLIIYNNVQWRQPIKMCMLYINFIIFDDKWFVEYYVEY